MRRFGSVAGACIGLVTSITASQAMAQIEFADFESYPALNWPFDIEAADVDGDVDLDLLFTLRGSASLGTLLNDGAGGFVDGGTVGTGGEPTGLAVADLNGDGHVDVAVANFAGNSVTVRLNDGAGVMSSPAAYPVGSLPDGTEIADLNGDGAPDIVVCNAISGSISVLFNNGVGQFPARVDYSTGSQPYRVAIDDYDGDDHPDLAVMNFLTGIVSTHLNNGVGIFTAADSYPLGHQSLSMCSGDIDGDGDVDLVPGAAALLNGGTGDFVVEQRPGVGGPDAIVDIDLDGDLDLVISDSVAQVVVFANQGDGQFDAGLAFATPARPRMATVADLNGDGLPDLAATNGPWLGGAGGNIAVMLNVPPCPADLSEDGTVDVQDLLLVIVNWGACLEPPALCFDVNEDGIVDVQDLVEVVLSWGACG